MQSIGGVQRPRSEARNQKKKKIKLKKKKKKDAAKKSELIETSDDGASLNGGKRGAK